ncbi:Ni/Fe hydrogenase subunit alpha [Inmirania thermothiophila]|uniref:Coenzyme F420-reducing hydrogenase alpha subunit n=1 Tax=Inmirania thermothiophila TaxID=1750597 RepID=A0A3N1Y1Q0_9GAMM|nr:nickel-dependent hydrogenase large subunit [Inmirania thermothiophila]ROR32755.1 coenzyme F420-reducing hydrogenase alpha subunit [Inmirania thermothiophila]
MSRRIEIRVPALARVEGEGALELAVADGRIEQLRLRIYEPPRLFERFLEGRDPHEVPDLVARICGICPVAYQMTAVHAFEDLAGVDPGAWVAAMRRVVYCGEWIESHALHIHLLALPDFLGYDNAVDMARAHREVVSRGLRLQALGNEIIRLFGGRSVHPVGLRVGGLHRAPRAAEVAALRGRLEDAVVQAEALVRWCAGLELPEDAQEFTCVALRHARDYAIERGRIVSSRGHDLAPAEWERHFAEHQVPHSTALHAHLDGAPYLVGPLARLNLNHDRLPEATRDLVRAAGLALPSRNMFHSMLARALEIHFALVEAVRLLAGYGEPEAAAVPVAVPAGVAFAATEAPRGLLWHRYEVGADGLVRRARIVPPTSQNQARIEADLAAHLEAFGLHRDDEALRRRAETVVRNYDPCISCSTHFLRTVEIRRR